MSPFATTYVWRGGDGWAVVPAVGIVMKAGARVGLPVIVGLDAGAVALPHVRRRRPPHEGQPGDRAAPRCWWPGTRGVIDLPPVSALIARVDHPAHEQHGAGLEVAQDEQERVIERRVTPGPGAPDHRRVHPHRGRRCRLGALLVDVDVRLVDHLR